MKIQILMIAFLMILFGVKDLNAQIRAITENGDSIFVYRDGTWSFTEKPSSSADSQLSFLDREFEIDTIQQKFKVDPSATKEAKNKFGLFKILYNENNWDRIPPGKLNNDEAEMAFISKEKDLYCLVVSEEAEIGTQNILKIALGMMEQRTNGEVDLMKVEQRMVNDQKIIRGLYQVDISGMILRFDSYFYSSEKGTIQFITWAGVNIWERNEKKIEKFLNGLVIL